MLCPNCGTENADTYKFCKKCGTRLPEPAVPPRPVAPPPPQRYAPPVAPGQPTGAVTYIRPKNPVAEIAVMAAVGTGIGGALILLGWFTPWFSLLGLLGRFIGSFAGQFGGSLLGSTAGAGNALQLTFLSITVGLAALQQYPQISLLSLALAAFLIAIVIFGGTFIRDAVRMYELRTANPATGAAKLEEISDYLTRVRGRALPLVITLGIIFLISAAIPFASAILGMGFWLTLLGAGCVYGTAWYTMTKIRALVL